MSSHRVELLSLCAGYVLGALDEAERLELEQHLADGCAECEAELRHLADGVTLLAAAAPPVAPPPALRARVLERVRVEGRARSAATADGVARTSGKDSPPRVLALPRRRPDVWTFAWAAAAAVLAVTSLVTWRASDRLRGDVATLEQQLETERQQLAAKRQELAEAERWSALLEGTATRVVDLQITPQGNAVLKARAIYDPQSRRAMIVFTNFAPPTGADYELWALRGGQAQSLGVIHADASGRAVVRLPDTGNPADLGAFAVSLEKAGGSSSPSAPEGPVVMVGKLAGS